MERDYMAPSCVSAKDRTEKLKIARIFRIQNRLWKDELYIRLKDQHRHIRTEK